MKPTAIRCWHCAVPSITAPSLRCLRGINTRKQMRKNHLNLPMKLYVRLFGSTDRWASEGDAVEEAQRTDGVHLGGPGRPVILDEKKLIGADLLRAKMRGGDPKMLGKVSDTAEVTAHGMGGVVAELQVFQHALAQGCHA